MAQKAEFMKVRKYIVDAIATSNGAPLRFPPTRKLGEKIGVSQPTALRAVKDLIAGGFLTPVPGGGTVSCPLSAYQDGIKIFGLLPHLGNQSFTNHYFMALTSVVGLEITRRNSNYCTQDIYLESPSLLEKTVQEDSISGLVLCNSREAIAEPALKLKANGLPVVAFMRDFDGISSFHSPNHERFAAILEKLFGEGRRHILVASWPTEYFVRGIAAGIELACERCGIPVGQVMHLYQEVHEIRSRIKEMLDFGMRFDAVVFYPFDDKIHDMVRQACGDKCRFVCDELSVSDELNYTGYAVTFDLKSAAAALVDDLLEQMKNPGRAPVDYHIKYTIKSYQEGKAL